MTTSTSTVSVNNGSVELNYDYDDDEFDDLTFLHTPDEARNLAFDLLVAAAKADGLSASEFWWTTFPKSGEGSVIRIKPLAELETVA